MFRLIKVRKPIFYHVVFEYKFPHPKGVCKLKALGGMFLILGSAGEKVCGKLLESEEAGKLVGAFDNPRPHRFRCSRCIFKCSRNVGQIFASENALS